jgi:protein-L-isoaspartate(D-aspartate) O-methyltransferase
VYGVELDEELAAQAAHSLRLAGIENVTVVVADGSAGLPGRAPFQAINVAASARGCVPAQLEQQLAVGGRLIAPVDLPAGEHLVLVRRSDDGLERRTLDAVRFVPLQ